MEIEFPMDNVADINSIGGLNKIAAGTYHAEIVSVDPDGGHNGAMVVGFEVLRGTVSNQEGRVHNETFFKDLSKESCAKKFGALSLACEFQTLEDIAKRGARFDTDKLVGKQVVLELSEFRDFMNISYSDHLWHPASKKASNCPLHVAKLNAAGIKLPPGRNPEGSVKLASATDKKSSGASNKPSPTSQAASVDELLA